MPVCVLGRKPVFPPLDSAEANGLLALGGDLSEQRMLTAYSRGIFPWYSEGQPVLWWSPDPRLVLFPDELHVPKRLDRVIRKGIFRVAWNSAFAEIIRTCAAVHLAKDGGTWITEDMIEAYIRLHRAGYAWSVESYCDDRLAGGLYGVALGNVFFGESMFATTPDASKVAFVAMARKMAVLGCRLIDCQVTSAHLKLFGAREIRRSDFSKIVTRETKRPQLRV